MSAYIKPLGMLKSYTEGESLVSCGVGITVRAALQSISIPDQLVALVMVNGKPQDKEYILQEEDIVQVLAVIGGG